ncbi:hypothetical protein NLO95_01640 [Pseudomonas syringae]|nr:hypothetical protein [Pseudomonas syringae]
MKLDQHAKHIQNLLTDMALCRKGAKVYFREKCREWGKRRNRDGSDASQAVQERFCSAGDGFNPLS